MVPCDPDDPSTGCTEDYYPLIYYVGPNNFFMNKAFGRNELLISSAPTHKHRLGSKVRIDKLNFDIFESNLVNVDRYDPSTFD